jgi:hypothetical protein
MGINTIISMTQHPNAALHLKKYAQSEKGKKKINKYNLTIKARFIRSKYAANKKNTIFTLTFEEYEKAISDPCYYCQDFFDKKSKTGIGLDRMDNSKGYEIGNVISCCGRCNIMKSNWMSAQETVAVINLIKNMRGV